MEVTLEEALKNSSPYSKEEAGKIIKRIENFYKRLAKDFDTDRFHFNVSTFHCIINEEGALTNQTGHSDASRVALANVFLSYIEEVTKDGKTTKEVALLQLVTELANDVRKLWQS